MDNDVRAWKDPLYRERLLAEGIPAFHPAGFVELTDDDLKRASGMAGVVPQTTALDCTDFTFRNWRSCGCGT